MSVERSFEAWEEVQRHGQDLADRLAQGFTGLIQSHMTNPPSFHWPNPSKSKLFDLEFPISTSARRDFAIPVNKPDINGVLAIFDIGNRIGQAGADFGACLNGLVHQFFRQLPLPVPFKQEESGVKVDLSGNSLRSDVGVRVEESFGLRETEREILRGSFGAVDSDGGGDNSDGLGDDEIGGLDLRAAAHLGRPQVSMELLNHVESGGINPIRIKNVYDIWMKRIGLMKESPLQDKFMVQLEFIIFCLTQGDVEEAHQGAISLMQEREFMSHPMSNMVMALIFYERWHSSIPREMLWNDSDQIYSPMRSDHSEERFSQRAGNAGVHATVYSREAETHFRDYSDASIMIEKQVSMEIHSDLHREVPRQDHVNIQRENAPIYIQPLSLCMNSAENEASFSDDGGPVNFASVFSALEGLDPWLLPIQLPKSYEDFENFMKKHEKLLNDDYKKAVKYLRLALYSTPPVSSALLPFIQLLLIGGHVDEALKELDKFCNNAESEIPVRLRASLLECFDRNNCGMLSTCYEDILKKDPTCCRSLARLISMHQNGDYNTESLLEMIALHLDATCADYNTWREFALCFLKLAWCEEDRMSVCLNGNDGDKKQRFSVHYNRIPNIFTEGKSGKNWMLRSQWWLRRHFSKNILASDIAAGDIQLLTYKAACASHIYGQEFDYVVKAYSSLAKENDRDLFMFLQMHRQNSIRLYVDYINRNK